MTTPPNDGTGTDDQGQQDGRDGQQQTDPPIDLFEIAGDLLAQADYPPEVVQQIRDSFDYGETFNARRLRIIEESNPEIATKIRQAIEEEAAGKAADAARAAEQERLDALQAQEHTEEMARLQEEADALGHEAELGAFLADGGLAKAKALAEAISSKETSNAEALVAWDQADPLAREIAQSTFRTGVVDFDIEEVLGRGGAS